MINQIAPFIICILFLLLVGYFIYRMGGGYVITDSEAVDEDAVEVLTDQRNNILNNIVYILAVEFNLSKDDLKPQYEAMGFNKDLITLDFLYHKLRIYCDWDRNRIKFAFSSHYDSFHYTSVVSMKVKSGTLDFEKLERIVHKWEFKVANGMFPTENDRIIECIAAAKDIANDDNFADEQVVKMLFQAWQGSKIRNTVRYQKDDMIDFIRLTGFLMRFYPEELIKFVKEMKNSAEDKEEEEVKE